MRAIEIGFYCFFSGGALGILWHLCLEEVLLYYMQALWTKLCPRKHVHIGWGIEAYFTYSTHTRACVWHRVIVLEYHHIVEGSLQGIFPLSTALLDTDGHFISFHLTQLVLLLSFHWICA